MKKAKVLETLSQFPKDVNINDLFEKLLIIEKIERGLEQLEIGEVVSHEKVVEHFNKKWPK